MAATWVVYRRPTKDNPAGSVGVCSKAEWAVMKDDTWGTPVVVRDGFQTEGEAERAARQETTKRASQARPSAERSDED
jgi:hypothetical protein